MNENRLEKKLDFRAATALAAGSMIGAGVFMKPASMAAQLGSPVWLTLVWVIAGLFSLGGALVFAELGAMFPATGGAYVYFRKMFGDLFAFVYGWSAFAVINTAAVAAMAFVCAQYADYFLQLPQPAVRVRESLSWHIPYLGQLYPLRNLGVKCLAAGIVLLLTFLNYRSVKAGSSFQVVSTFFKILVVVALVAGIFLSPNGSTAHFISASAPAQGWSLLGGIVAAMTGAFFAYDGWINVSSMGGEIRDPQRNIPRSLAAGVCISLAVYVLINQAYLYALPVEKMGKSGLVAADAIHVAWGYTGGAVIAALIVICTFSAINGNIMATTRISYAMGRDRVFLPWAGITHRRFQTPGNALWLHGAWTCMFIFSGTFDMLADMFVFMTWVAYGVGAAGLLWLRKRNPGADRPYRVPGYPWVPLLFILFSAFYLGMTIWNDVANYMAHRQPMIHSLLGLVLTAAGIPVYLWVRKKAPSPMTG